MVVEQPSITFTRISIHAPTRGATRSYLPVGSGVFISIHAPTRGATLMNFLTDVLYEFQSTLLQEERHVGNGYMYWISKISIHAPTRGATHGPCECLQLYPYFNPRSYKRSDYYDVVVDRDVDLFQSTLLQEERRRIVCPADHYSYFNPRSYKRSDHFLAFSHRIVVNFNPRSYKRSDASNNS